MHLFYFLHFPFPQSVYSNTLDSLFCLCPFSLYAFIQPCICLTNYLLLLLRLLFFSSASSQNDSPDICESLKGIKRNLEAKVFNLSVWLRLTISLIQHYKFPSNNIDVINEFIWPLELCLNISVFHHHTMVLNLIF